MQFTSPLRYPGAKVESAPFLVAHFPEKIVEYREPMVGGGSVFLTARSNDLAARYVINDLYSPLMDFWKCAADKSDNQLLRQCLQKLFDDNSTVEERRAWFAKFKCSHTAALELTWGDVRLAQAVRIFFLNRCSFSGTTEMGGFSSDSAKNRFTQSSIHRIEKVQTAFDSCKILCGDYTELLDGSKDDFIFLDPPYASSKRLYVEDAMDHNKLSFMLRITPSRFLMTLDHTDETRRLYSWANLKPFRLQYSMDNCNFSKKPKRGEELLVANYDFSRDASRLVENAA